MIDLISLQEAKDHLRVTASHADNDIQLKIFAASAILFNYIKVDIDESPLSLPWFGSETPWDIKAACMLILGDLYQSREGTSVENTSRSVNPLSDAVKDLLWRYRDPALA